MRAIALSALMLPLLASAVTITMDVQPRALRQGEMAQLSLTIEGAGNIAPPDLPDIDGLQVLGSSSSQQSSFDGHTKRESVSRVFTVQPTRTGTIRIGPFSYPLGGEKHDIPAIDLQVLDAAAGASPSGQEPLFATLTADVTNLYHQQTFELTLTIYSRGLNLDRQVGADFPADGLKVEALREIQGGREVVENQIYDVRRWRGKVTALTAGAFHLQPTVRVGVIAANQRRNRDPFFGDMLDDFLGRREVRMTEVPVHALDLTVKSLPAEGRPAGFTGAVGQFTLDVRLQPTELSAGEPVTATLMLSGRGNIALVAPPALHVDDQFRTYDAKLVSDEVDANAAAGRKVFEQVLIPRNGSITNIPAVDFSYFNPESGRYETLRRGPFPIVVHAGSNEASRLVQAPDPAAPAAERVRLGTDIGYLKPAPRAWPRAWDAGWIAHPAFLAAQAAPPLALGLLALVVRRRTALAGDVRRARRAQAPRVARTALGEAEAALRRGDAAAYHEALWRALTAYFAHRLNLQPGEATRDVVLARLAAAQAPADLQEAIRLSFVRCEEARFGAAGGALDGAREREVVEQLTRHLRTCEGLPL